MKFLLILATLLNSIFSLASDTPITPQTTAKKYVEQHSLKRNRTQMNNQGVITQEEDATLKLRRQEEEEEEEEQRKLFFMQYGPPLPPPFNN